MMSNGIVKRLFRKALSVYLIMSGVFFTGYILLYHVNDLTYSKITETHTVLGYAVRPSIDGQLRTVIVGEIKPNGVPMTYTEVEVDDIANHPIGSKVKYSCYVSSIRGNRGWGQLIADAPAVKEKG